MSNTTRLYVSEAIIELLDKANDRELHLVWVFLRSFLGEKVRTDG